METKFKSCKVLVNIQPTLTRCWGGGGGEEIANENHENLTSISFVTPDVCFLKMCLRLPLVPRFTEQPKPNRKKTHKYFKEWFSRHWTSGYKVQWSLKHGKQTRQALWLPSHYLERVSRWLLRERTRAELCSLLELRIRDQVARVHKAECQKEESYPERELRRPVGGPNCKFIRVLIGTCL